jgi:inhibitor of KinA sporulation pathway (predicted exonuclease)
MQFNALIVLTLSVTADDPTIDVAHQRVTPETAEMIELVWSVLDMTTLSTASVERVLIKPESTPLTEYCTKYTGLTNEDLAEAGDFSIAIQNLKTFIETQFTSRQCTFCFCTHGIWELRTQLPGEAARKNVTLPSYLASPKFFDLKQELNTWSKHHPELGLETTGVEDLRAIAQTLGLSTGLETMSALNRATLITEIAKHMLQERSGTVFNQPIDTGADHARFLEEQSRVVHLSGLPENCTQPELHAWLAQAGSPPEMLWMIRGPYDRAGGTGFAIARTHEEALQMLTLNGRQLRDRAVNVSPSSEQVLEAASGITGPFPVGVRGSGVAWRGVAWSGVMWCGAVVDVTIDMRIRSSEQ